MQFYKLSDKDLLNATQTVALREKGATLELLEHLLEVEKRDLVFKQGFSSIWDYLHRGLNYCESAASERVAAMRLLKRAPEAAELMNAQKLSLSTAAKVQHFVRAVEKTEKRKVDSNETGRLLAQVSGKSRRDVEKLFVALAPNLAHLPKERTREITPELTEIKIVVDAETIALLEEAKTLFGCATHADTLKRTLKIAITRKKKELGLEDEAPNTHPDQIKSTPAAGVESNSRYIPIALKRATWRRANSKCEYVGPSGRCTSTHKLQVDHFIPLALGGKTTLENLRLLCQNHNLAELFNKRWRLIIVLVYFKSILRVPKHELTA